MKVTKLGLRQFRNLTPLSLVPHENLNLIVGLNASGKTNLCEALYFASRGQLLKGERQRDLIQWTCSWSTLDLDVDAARAVRPSAERIRIHLNGEEAGKTIELDGAPAQQRDVFEVLKVLIFTPDDLQTIKGSPARRRRLLDHGIADLVPAYRRELGGLEQVLRRKNALLRRERIDPELLAVYNQALARHGARLLAQRTRHVAALNAHLGAVHRALNQPGKALQLRYESALHSESALCSESADAPADDAGREAAWAAALGAALEAAAGEERRRGVSLIGPQRDDLAFDLEGVDLRRFGSQGQQKTALVALKLAQLALFRERTGDYPVLVFDDVLSELDPERTQLLLDHLPRDLQLFLTETQLTPPLRARAGKVFCVAQGRVEEAP